MKCNCEDWKYNTYELDRPWGLWIAHGGEGYKGKFFVFCLNLP